MRERKRKRERETEKEGEKEGEIRKSERPRATLIKTFVEPFFLSKKSDSVQSRNQDRRALAVALSITTGTTDLFVSLLADGPLLPPNSPDNCPL